jgi:hypothetical protein
MGSRQGLSSLRRFLIGCRHHYTAFLIRYHLLLGSRRAFPSYSYLPYIYIVVELPAGLPNLELL